jgi:hypothetical protein
MKLETTFIQVKEFLKKDQPDYLDDIDKLYGLIIIISTAAIGPPALPLLTLLTTKNELFKIGKSILNRFKKKKETDIIDLYARMKIAYGLVVYCAFIEAVEKNLPAEVLNFIKEIENNTGAEFVGKSSEGINLSESQLAPEGDKFSKWPIYFPHPAETIADQKVSILELYKSLIDGLIEFSKNVIGNDLTDTEKTKLLDKIKAIPTKAIQVFEVRYFELCKIYEDFAIWSNLHHHSQYQKLLFELSDYVREYSNLYKDYKNTTDIGFDKLHSIVCKIPESLKISQSQDIIESLSKHYDARSNESIVETSEDSRDEVSLSFPTMREAFVPQSYKFLRYNSKIRRLEDESLWNGIERKEDLGLFIINYLSSPYSLETPLVILGHPGSGKSLLTTIISAKIMCPQYTAIKVSLREVNSEIGIVNQIEEQISKITNIKVDSWAKLSGSFSNAPLIVILDGYDELLQASGKVFAGYLKDVQNFQKNEYEQGRPVRVILTSRITLIDKATIPIGTSIIRLMEFSDFQRNEWISIWNKCNSNYFARKGVRPFELPTNTKLDSNQVLLLAQQPLLLLMLALYDSENNLLGTNVNLDRTALYDSLLRRFILRERSKEKGFGELPRREIQNAIDFEMRRLSVAAIGMYNRRKLHILSNELNDDLSFFNLERQIEVSIGRPLSQADLLLGSFFFVHKSKLQQKSESSYASEEISAFEFLHNTFGEFLTADFIIRQSIGEVQILRALKGNNLLISQYDQKLNDADGLSKDWFAGHIYTPLFTRPVVLEMIREWIAHRLIDSGITRDEFIAEFDILVTAQIQRILNKRQMPSLMSSELMNDANSAPFGNHPLIGHISIYSINLIILRTIFDIKPYVFEETKFDRDHSTPAWNQIINIWKSWFSIETLQAITSILSSKRDNNQIYITPDAKFRSFKTQGKLETFFNVSAALSDNVGTMLAGLVMIESGHQSILGLEEIFQLVTSEQFEYDLSLLKVKIDLLLDENDRGSGRRIDTLRVFRKSLMESRIFNSSSMIVHRMICSSLRTYLNRDLYEREDALRSIMDLVAHIMDAIDDHEKNRERVIGEYIKLINDLLYYHYFIGKIPYRTHMINDSRLMRRMNTRRISNELKLVFTEFEILSHGLDRSQFRSQRYDQMLSGYSRRDIRELIDRRPHLINFLFDMEALESDDLLLDMYLDILNNYTFRPSKLGELRYISVEQYAMLKKIHSVSHNPRVRVILDAIELNFKL